MVLYWFPWQPSWVFKFSDFIQLSIIVLQSNEKKHLAIEIYKIVRMSVSVSKKLKIRSQHTNCMTYYGDVTS